MVLFSIVERIAGRIMRTWITNYLDDFLFIYITQEGCNHIVIIFLNICEQIRKEERYSSKFVSLEKTQWASTQIIFLGMLLNGKTYTLSISLERRETILKLVKKFKDKRKLTVKELQQLAGHLNFINRAIVPGRAFTRRMYAKFSGNNILKKDGTMLKPYHHIKLDIEFRLDCAMWEYFLTNLNSVTRPFIYLSNVTTAESINFYSDASACETLGYGVIFRNNWIYGKWVPDFIRNYKPSIEFLELFALCAGVLTYENQIKNTRVIVHCDNQAVVHMVNNLTSRCHQCMKLIRLLTINNLQHDRRVFVQHIEGKRNVLSDVLSHLKLDKFFRLVPSTVQQFPDKIHP